MYQVSTTIVKYVLRDQELRENLNKEAKVFNLLKTKLTGDKMKFSSTLPVLSKSFSFPQDTSKWSAVDTS